MDNLVECVPQMISIDGHGCHVLPHSDAFLLRINSLRKIRQIQVILDILCKMQKSHRVRMGMLVLWR